MLSQEESTLSASCNPPNHAHAHAKPRPTGVAGASGAPLKSNMKCNT